MQQKQLSQQKVVKKFTNDEVLALLSCIKEKHSRWSIEQIDDGIGIYDKPGSKGRCILAYLYPKDMFASELSPTEYSSIVNALPNNYNTNLLKSLTLLTSETYAQLDPPVTEKELSYKNTASPYIDVKPAPNQSWQTYASQTLQNNQGMFIFQEHDHVNSYRELGDFMHEFKSIGGKYLIVELPKLIMDNVLNTFYSTGDEKALKRALECFLTTNRVSHQIDSCFYLITKAYQAGIEVKAVDKALSQAEELSRRTLGREKFDDMRNARMISNINKIIGSNKSDKYIGFFGLAHDNLANLQNVPKVVIISENRFKFRPNELAASGQSWCYDPQQHSSHMKNNPLVTLLRTEFLPRYTAIYVLSQEGIRFSIPTKKEFEENEHNNFISQLKCCGFFAITTTVAVAALVIAKTTDSFTP